MADISKMTKQKKIIRLCVWLLRKKLGECGTKEMVHDDMLNCGNDAVRIIHQKILNNANKIECPHQRKTISELSELALWILAYKDTAYRDEFFATLDDILKDADKIRKLIKPYIKPANRWQVNVWWNTKKITKEKQDSGQLLEGQKSEAESVFVKNMLQKKLSKNLNMEIRR